MTSYNSVLPLDMGVENPFRSIIPYKPYYFTEHGSAYLADSLEVMKNMPESSVNLIVTSPPYALVYGSPARVMGKVDRDGNIVERV